MKLVIGGAACLLLVLVAFGPALADQLSYAADGARKPAPQYLAWACRVLLGLTLFGATVTITVRNPVVAALSLVGTLFCTGGLYLVMHATFLAAIQVLVYAGAIMVLFIFIVMAVGHPEQEEIGLTRGWFSKLLIGGTAVALLLVRLVPILMGRDAPAPRELVPGHFGDVNTIGRLLFSDLLFPFEAISILLLVAIVAAVMVTRRPVETPATPAAPPSTNTQGGH